MTTVYFVRHAQPVHSHADDRTRPLSAEGMADRAIVLEYLRDKGIDAFYCSPYKRSMDTIAQASEHYGMTIVTDERFRERECGEGGNMKDMGRKRWADHDFHEPGGESLRMVQRRNMAALEDVLDANEGKTVVIGTHGTALSTILHHYDRSFGFDDFWRIVDWMPFIIRLRFRGRELADKAECIHIYKEFKG